MCGIYPVRNVYLLQPSVCNEKIQVSFWTASFRLNTFFVCVFFFLFIFNLKVPCRIVTGDIEIFFIF